MDNYTKYTIQNYTSKPLTSILVYNFNQHVRKKYTKKVTSKIEF